MVNLLLIFIPGPMMLIHHTISILGNVMVLLLGISGTEFIACIFGSEATNPFLQTRWFLRQTNRHKSWYGEINDLTFMLLFGFLRVGVGGNLLYWYMQHPRPIMAARIGGTLFYLIGVIWMVQILLYARRKYSLMYRTWISGRKNVFVDPDSETDQEELVTEKEVGPVNEKEEDREPVNSNGNHQELVNGKATSQNGAISKGFSAKSAKLKTN